jgi:hypothetical protein
MLFPHALLDTVTGDLCAAYHLADWTVFERDGFAWQIAPGHSVNANVTARDENGAPARWEVWVTNGPKARGFTLAGALVEVGFLPWPS